MKDEMLAVYEKEIPVPTGAYVSRAECHSMGICHACVQMLVVWNDKLIFQIRSWKKDNYPGCLDISVGGHLKDPSDMQSEMLEEIGLSSFDVSTVEVGPYLFTEKRDGFWDVEWRFLYLAYLDNLEKIVFKDGEVAGIVVVPVEEAVRFLRQSSFPIASGMRESLPRCLPYLV